MKRYLVLFLMLFSLPGLLLAGCKKQEVSPPAPTAAPDNTFVKEADYPAVLAEAEKTGIMLEEGLYLTALHPYSGVYPEDGSGKTVENVAAADLVNLSAVSYRYLEFTVSAGDTVYTFFVSTLPVGGRLTVAEKNAAPYEALSEPVAAVTSVAAFDSPPSVYPGLVKLSYGDETVRAENLTDHMLQNVSVYYKTVNENGYLGGLTYRVQLGDLGPGAVKTSAAAHLGLRNAKIVFVTLDEPDAETSEG